jgi:hypothetical protein
LPTTTKGFWTEWFVEASDQVRYGDAEFTFEREVAVLEKLEASTAVPLLPVTRLKIAIAGLHTK